MTAAALLRTAAYRLAVDIAQRDPSGGIAKPRAWACAHSEREVARTARRWCRKHSINLNKDEDCGRDCEDFLYVPPGRQISTPDVQSRDRLMAEATRGRADGEAHASARLLLCDVLSLIEEGLPTSERKLFMLAVEGHSSQSIGASFGLDPATVRSKVRQVRARLRRL